MEGMTLTEESIVVQARLGEPTLFFYDGVPSPSTIKTVAKAGCFLAFRCSSLAFARTKARLHMSFLLSGSSDITRHYVRIDPDDFADVPRRLLKHVVVLNLLDPGPPPPSPYIRMWTLANQEEVRRLRARCLAVPGMKRAVAS
jgi:hypothetical protein